MDHDKNMIGGSAIHGPLPVKKKLVCPHHVANNHIQLERCQ